MLQRNSIVIEKSKSHEFRQFISRNAKSKAYWEDIQKVASESVDKKKLDALFEKEK